MDILVTGAAGFIGSAVAHRLLDRGDTVIGIDNLNDYYEVTLKEARLARLTSREGFSFQKLDVADRAGMEALFADHKIDRVVHMAAQAGVRYSIENPHAYVDANLVGFMNVLEGCRHAKVEHLVYASSSSVYGANETLPFSVHHNVDHPVSLYAATKKANELMAHTRNILEGKPIDVFNYGHHRRDFTYIDDIVEGVIRTLDNVASGNPDWDGKAPDPGTSRAPWRVYNIGNSRPVELLRYIEVIEQEVGKKAIKNLLPKQPGDVPDTFADVEDLKKDVGYRPSTPVEEGVARFVAWYREYYRL